MWRRPIEYSYTESVVNLQAPMVVEGYVVFTIESRDTEGLRLEDHEDVYAVCFADCDDTGAHDDPLPEDEEQGFYRWHGLIPEAAFGPDRSYITVEVVRYDSVLVRGETVRVRMPGFPRNITTRGGTCGIHRSGSYIPVARSTNRFLYGRRRQGSRFCPTAWC